MNLINYSDEEITKLWNDYADNRNQGLKKIANKKLRDMINFINLKNKDEIKQFVDFICIERFEKGNIKDFQQPLIEDLILPILIEGVEAEIMPYLRWIYQLKLYSNSNYKKIDNIEYYNSEKILVKANLVDPNDISTVILLMTLYIDCLWFGSHHFPEHILFEKEYVDELLNKSSKIIETYKEKSLILSSMIKDIEYYKDLYESWFKYKNECLNISFTEWCVLNNKNYSWVKTFYYNKGNEM
ncbi:hypothetical protein [Clostridium saccharoperbutylacetonicum]|uniref:hypothetical protein n=1 Tax=Clostridium saccharoperbutylacetonicum TaxID=36745 RepID=UPI0039E8F253